MNELTLEDLVGSIVRRAGWYCPKEGEYTGVCHIVLDTNKGAVALIPTCSEESFCYIPGIRNAAILTYKIRGIETTPVIETDTEDDDVVSEWSHVFKTIKGSCVIKMRVDHTDFDGGKLKVLRMKSYPDNVPALVDFN